MRSFGRPIKQGEVNVGFTNMGEVNVGFTKMGDVNVAPTVFRVT